MTKKNTWQKTIRKGKQAEKEYGKLLAKTNNLEFHHEDGGKGFDFILRGKKKDFKIECKLQDRANCNIFLESSYKGEKSGLEATEADLWVICLPQYDYLLIFDPAEIKAYCEINKIRKVRGGDYNRSIGYTLPLRQLQNASISSYLCLKTRKIAKYSYNRGEGKQ